jgi:hypothetical protein
LLWLSLLPSAVASYSSTCSLAGTQCRLCVSLLTACMLHTCQYLSVSAVAVVIHSRPVLLMDWLLGFPDCRFEHQALLHSLLPRAAISKLKADLDLASGDSMVGHMYEQGTGSTGMQVAQLDKVTCPSQLGCPSQLCACFFFHAGTPAEHMLGIIQVCLRNCEKFASLFASL